MEYSVFKHLSPDFSRLKAFGFADEGEKFVLRAPILNGDFTVTVIVSCDGAVDTETIDEASGEPYTLHLVEEAQGNFVGSVRTAFTALLSEIAANCFVRDIFKSAQAHRLIGYVREKYACGLEFLWEKFPEDAVWRRTDNRKWFGILMRLSKKKLGLAVDTPIDILDVRADPQELSSLIDGVHYFPAYHMNKSHWLTLPIDGTLSDDEVFRFLDNSFTLAK